MTDKEKAKEYIRQIMETQYYPSYACYDCERLHEHNEQFGVGENEMLNVVYRAYLDGFSEGRQEKHISIIKGIARQNQKNAELKAQNEYEHNQFLDTSSKLEEQIEFNIQLGVEINELKSELEHWKNRCADLLGQLKKLNIFVKL